MFRYVKHGHFAKRFKEKKFKKNLYTGLSIKPEKPCSTNSILLQLQILSYEEETYFTV